MAVFWTFVISAIRICQDCNDTILGKHGRETCKVHEEDKNAAMDHAFDSAGRRAGWCE